jgi:transglutaminase-like putative cysteine protease
VSRRGIAATLILLAWAGGLGALAQRELFKGQAESFAELALRVQPETFYYVVEQGGQVVGYASSTIDTTRRAFLVRDEMAADLTVGGTAHRIVAASRVRLTRGFALTDFDVTVSADSAPIRIVGSAEGDSVIQYTVTGPANDPTPQRLAVRGPILLPTLIPLAVTLGAEPKVGRRATVPLFDPTTMSTRNVTMELKAESLFVVSDSAKLDSTANRWVVAHTDTVRAWRLGSGEPGESDRLGGWVDERGRLVESRQPGGLVLRRTAYEVAFENWRLRRADPTSAPARSDVLETTAVAAGVRWDKPLDRLQVRLRNVALEDFDLDGGRQRLVRDTLTIVREPSDSLVAGYSRESANGTLGVRFRTQLSSEPFVQVQHPEMQAAVQKIVGNEQDPRVAAQRLTAWVYRTVKKEYRVGIPDALTVLRTKAGDCNEHTQLYLALARTAGIPARAAAGLAYVNGRFFYHAWPEVWLGRWVAVDPTFGQFPADAAHLRFTIGGLARQAMLVQLIGTIGMDVLAASPDGAAVAPAPANRQ